MEIYSVNDLSFYYPESDEPALRNVSLTVSEAEFITICGLSGSGKSTLLRQLKSCLRPHGNLIGTVSFCGKTLDETDKLSQAQRIGFVMQSPHDQTITDTVMHELVFGLEGMVLSRTEMTQRAAEIVSCFGIEEILDKKTYELSGGQKQLLNLASIMVMHPQVIILDEPTAQLDPVAANEFISALKRIHSGFGTTVIVASHDFTELFPLSTRVIVMENGSIISDASPSQTGLNLYRKSKAFFSLPLPARLYLMFNEHQDNNVPDDLAKGRLWLRKYIDGKDIALESADNAVHIDGIVPYLSAENIRFRYDKNGRDIIRGAGLAAYPGEILAIVGGNGAGKTTLLNILSGALRPYEGRVKFSAADSGKEIKSALLPQEPKALFVKERVKEELLDATICEKIPQEERCSLVYAAAEICGIKEKLSIHPYDLSGGEQQKTALAKILLTSPHVMLLDEPVKGLDAAAKKEIGNILRRLKESGICIILISHDMDFCAEYADRCSFLFDGKLSEPCSSHEFFLRNTYYTSSAALLARNIIDDVVTEKDLFSSLGKSDDNNDDKNHNNQDELIRKLYGPRVNSEKKRSGFLKAFSVGSAAKIVLFVLFIASVFNSVNIFSYQGENNPIVSIVVSVMLGLLCFASELVFPGGGDSIDLKRPRRSKQLIITAAVSVLAVVPLTIFAGIYFLNDDRILFISLLILLECMLPFLIHFEGRSIRTRELVIISVMCAFCVIGRAAFYMLPEFKPVTALVIISGAALGGEAGFLIGAVSMLVSNIIFGQGPWTPWQMFAMGLIGFISGLCYSGRLIRKNRRSFAVFGFIASVIIYGGIMDPAAIIMSRLPFTPESVTAYYISGLPMDLVHGISSAVFLYFGAIPVLRKLERIKKKYGLIE